MRRHFNQLFLSLFLIFTAQFVHAQETQQIEPNKPIEREIAGGQEQNYQIKLTANQFVRFRLEQRAIDAALVLNAPDGKQLAEMNLTGAGEQESLSLEAASGIYKLTVRGIGTPKMLGSYRLEATVQPAATDSDRKYLTAQFLLLEAQDLAKQTPPPLLVIEKLEQSLSIWRELKLPFWAGLTLKQIGRTYMSLNQNEKAIGYQEQAITISRESKNRFREAIILNDLANSYYNQRQFDKAVEYFQQCLMIFREIKDRRKEGLTLYALGNTLNSQNQPDKAIEFYEQALP
ncbi:MAG: tetratricopeptide repeat protein, partial [Acidobacteriota bacterium]